MYPSLNVLFKNAPQIVLAGCLLLLPGCNHNPSFAPANKPSDSDNEMLSAGQNTIFSSSGSAFGSHFPGLNPLQDALFSTGDGNFSATFVTAPAPLNPGLGPVYNNVSCVSCHASDGRGAAPDDGGRLASMLFRVSIPGADEHGGPLDAPGLGGQLQDKAVFGIKPEAEVTVTWVEAVKKFADSSSAALRRPVYTLSNPAYPLPANLLLSPRIAPPMPGLGMLEAIAEADILALADPSDADGDGISGKPNIVWSREYQRPMLGRFGWKAEAPTLLQQVAGAYNQDMGITNFIFPTESYSSEAGQPLLPVELSDSLLYATRFYCKSLGVPVRRNHTDPDVVAGKALFAQAGCTGCHVSRFRTGTDYAYPQVSNQTIFPYTDLLLHNMGPDLADNRPAYAADGTEWRTPPLWGIGLTRTINGKLSFLHDGRARNITEAILWHGGEAEAARKAFQSMPAADRSRLLKFMDSL